MTSLSADRPSSDPKEDLFGHGPFAKNLADSICRYPGSDGLVLGLYGPWGSGKSTVLSYVRHFLEARPADEQPVIVAFNPWWFSGQDNLARAFLGQLQAVLPEKSEKFKKLGDLLGDFAEGVGGLIDLSGVTFGAGTVVGKLLGKVKRKPKDVPALKAAITKVLREAGKRILIVIDDIDRLTPEETRQLFTVIKAVADFPHVVYLLAFDREVAAHAIEQQSGMPGARYLEKIIQVPFELPPVDRVALRAALFRRLDEVLVEMPETSFDQSYWTNVFHDGIDPLIQVPRDIVRFINTLSVTYPSVAGEVNPVDFIAVEALRVFMPSVYEVLRSNPDHFAGHRPMTKYSDPDDKARQAFNSAWLAELPESLRPSTWALMERLFPKLEQSIYGAEWVPEWRSKLRVCVPELFPTYFRLAVPPGGLRRSEMDALLALAATPEAMGETLIKATHEKRPDGLSKARALLERLMDHVETDIQSQHIPGIVSMLLNIGDDLVLASDQRASFDFGNESRVTRVVYHLTKRVEQTHRLPMLRDGFKQGRAIGVQRYFLAALRDELAKPAQDGKPPLLDSVSLDELKAIWLAKIEATAGLLAHPQLARLLLAWREWGDLTDVKHWCGQATTSDEGLLAFVPKFCSHSTAQTWGDWAVQVQPRLNPSWIQDYVDIDNGARRLYALKQSGQVPETALEAVSQFLKEFEMIKAGKNPDSVGAFDN